MHPNLVGREMPGATVLITAKEIRRFADAIGDPDPIYRDVQAARAAGHAGIPIPPTYGAFLMMDRDDPNDFIPILGIDMRRILHAEQRFTYHAPVHAGDRLVITERVTETYQKKNGALQFLVLDAELRKPDGTLALEVRRVLVERHG